MSFGFMGKILRVDLSSGRIAEEEVPAEWNRNFLGGAGVASKYLFEEVPPDTDPLGSDNKLIFMAGPLTGTSSASASRYSVVAKSPLTGIWGHGNSGGNFGPAMKRAGFDGFIIDIPPIVDPSAYTTVLVWCEAFGEFITAASYR